MLLQNAMIKQMRQAKDLVEKRVFKEAEQLYSRVYDIVSSFSPENSPMLDVVNRKFVSFVCSSVGNWICILVQTVSQTR